MNCESCEEPKKLLHGRRHRLGVDHLLRHQRLGLGDRQALLDARSTRTRPTRKAFSAISPTLRTRRITEVVDVVHLAIAVTNVDQHLHTSRMSDVWPYSPTNLFEASSVRVLKYL